MVKKVLTKIKEYVLVCFAAGINSFLLHTFVNPIQLIPGGVSGLASITNYIFPQIPISILYFAYNVPLLIWALISLRGDFTIKTIVATIFGSVCLEYLPKELIFADEQGILISSIMAGILCGISMYVIYCNNGSNGGSEVVARIINKNHPEIDVGHVIMIINLVLLLAGGILLQDLMILVYSLVMSFCASSSLDIFTRGFDHPLRFSIVTKNADKLAKQISDTFGRGVTIFPVYNEKGEKSDYQEVVAVVQYRQSARLRRIIKKEGGCFVCVKEVINIFTRPVFHRYYRIDSGDKK